MLGCCFMVEEEIVLVFVVLMLHLQCTALKLLVSSHVRKVFCKSRILETTTAAAVVLWPFVWDYPGESVPEETFTHSQSHLS